MPLLLRFLPVTPLRLLPRQCRLRRCHAIITAAAILFALIRVFIVHYAYVPLFITPRAPLDARVCRYATFRLTFIIIAAPPELMPMTTCMPLICRQLAIRYCRYYACAQVRSLFFYARCMPAAMPPLIDVNIMRATLQRQDAYYVLPRRLFYAIACMLTLRRRLHAHADDYFSTIFVISLRHTLRHVIDMSRHRQPPLPRFIISPRHTALMPLPPAERCRFRHAIVAITPFSMLKTCHTAECHCPCWRYALRRLL